MSRKTDTNTRCEERRSLTLDVLTELRSARRAGRRRRRVICGWFGGRESETCVEYAPRKHIHRVTAQSLIHSQQP